MGVLHSIHPASCPCLSLPPTPPLATRASCLAAPSDIRYVYWTRPERGKLLDLNRDNKDAKLNVKVYSG